MGCCQSENRLQEFEASRGTFHARPAMLEQMNYAGTPYYQVMDTPLSSQNQETTSFTDRANISRIQINFRKQLSEIREQDPHMEQSIQHIDGSISKSRVTELIDPFSEIIKEQSFYKSPKTYEIASVKPFIAQNSTSPNQGQFSNLYSFSLAASPLSKETNH